MAGGVANPIIYLCLHEPNNDDCDQSRSPLTMKIQPTTLSTSLLFSLSISLCFLTHPAQAQTCSERQIKADLLRLTNRSFSLPSLSFPFPISPPVFGQINVDLSGELERNPLQDLPAYDYRSSFTLATAANTRILECGDQGIAAIANILKDKSANPQLREALPEILLTFESDPQQILDILTPIISDKDENTFLRSTALKAYAEIADQNFNEFLLPFLKTEKDFGQYVIPYFVTTDPNLDTTIENLITLLFYEDPAASLRSPYYAAQVLGNIAQNDPVAITALTEIMALEVATDLRIHAAAALNKLQPNSASAKTFLMNVITDNKQAKATHVSAATALGTIQINPLEFILLVQPLFEGANLSQKSTIENALVMAMFNLETYHNISQSQVPELISALQAIVDKYRPPNELTINSNDYHFFSRNIASLELTIVLLKTTKNP